VVASASAYTSACTITISSPTRSCSAIRNCRPGVQVPVVQCAGVPTMYTTRLPDCSASVSVTACNGHGSGVSEQYGSTPRWSSLVGVSNGSSAVPVAGVITSAGSNSSKVAPNPSSPSMRIVYTTAASSVARTSQYGVGRPSLRRVPTTSVTRVPLKSSIQPVMVAGPLSSMRSASASETGRRTSPGVNNGWLGKRCTSAQPPSGGVVGSLAAASVPVLALESEAFESLPHAASRAALPAAASTWRRVMFTAATVLLLRSRFPACESHR